MKKILFLILFFNTNFLFGMEKPPVSTQKISNTTLTCPSGKWCRVQITTSMSINIQAKAHADLKGTSLAAITSMSIEPVSDIFSIDLRSSETINCSTSSLPTESVAANILYIWKPYISCNVSGVQFYLKHVNAIFVVPTGASPFPFGNVFSIASNYSFYSTEYFN